MPTYDYLCEDCNYGFEEFQSMTAAPLEKCPKCDGTVRRLIGSGNGLIFKGSGFYITDYKKSNSTSEKTTSEPSSSKPEKKAGDKSKTS